MSITLPDGSGAPDDAALSAWLGRPVALRSTLEAAERRYENPDDFENETSSRWQPFAGSSGAFHDSAGAAISLLSAATIGEWPRRRFRANVMLDGAGEDALVGTQVTVGGTHLDVGMRIGRCVMVTRPQPGSIARDLDVLRTIQRERQGFLAVGATVGRPGTISVGDAIEPASVATG